MRTEEKVSLENLGHGADHAEAEARLEKNIGEVELMLAEDRAWLKAEPDSTAAQTQLASTQNHLADLQRQLSHVKEESK